MDLYQSFHAFIQTNRLLYPDERVLLAVSGGIDSLVMAHLFRESGRLFGIAHCNFQLRGAESNGDEAFVRDLAAAWQVAFFSQKFETKKFTALSGQSTQMAARTLRYEWFEQIRAENRYDAIATGHNRDDSVETALFHFIRGTGLTGLGGIPARNGRLIRPLLFAGREDILAYARANGLHWREDSSNASDDYTRNIIRHHLVPRMQEINPTFLPAAEQTLRHLRASDANLRYLLERLLGRADAEGVYTLDKKALESLPSLTDALFDLFQPFGFFPEQLRQLVENWHQSGAEWTSDTGYRLLNDRQKLLFFRHIPAVAEMVKIDPDDIMVSLPDGGRLVLTPADAGTPFPDGNTSVVVNAEKLRFPLLLRRWQPGDVFQPLGMGGHSRKLQDFFTDRKLSKLEKEQVWILENGDQTIIWVVGMRLDERFKTEEESFKLLKISWIKHL
jgi:tRNA(Ile)-lysidine synthase